MLLKCAEVKLPRNQFFKLSCQTRKASTSTTLI